MLLGGKAPEREVMSHPNRARRRANRTRRRNAAIKQSPLPMFEQTRRAEERQAKMAATINPLYRFPPTYHDKPKGIR